MSRKRNIKKAPYDCSLIGRSDGTQINTDERDDRRYLLDIYGI